MIGLGNPGLSQIQTDLPRLRCGAGAMLKAVATEACNHQLRGFEFMEGIPGSVGGAVRGNAGAFGVSIGQMVESVRVLDSNNLQITNYGKEFSRIYLFQKTRTY